jgi:AbrB family looped-hinge helix DNA binding protein
MKPLQVPELTRISSKGQIVIPSKFRRELRLKEGNIFAVSSKDDMIVLKKLETGLKPDDLKTLKLIEEAWEDLEKGRYKIYSKDAFLKEFKKW